jgi:hypothetical protein
MQSATHFASSMIRLRMQQPAQRTMAILPRWSISISPVGVTDHCRHRGD